MKEACMHSGENATVAQQISRWGNAASIALLDPSCSIFSVPHLEGVIGYRVASQYAIVFGDPVCEKNNVEELTYLFHDYCERHKKKIIYIATSEQFAHWSLNHCCKAAIEVGSEVILNPLLDPMQKTGKKASLLRNKYNQAMRDGIVVKEYHHNDAYIEEEMQKIRAAWLNNRKGPQLCLLQIDIFSDRNHKRYFYAHHQGKIVGMAILNRIDAYKGWVLNILMALPDAPTVTSEFLIINMLSKLRSESCPFLSVGTLPATRLGKIEGLGPFSQWCTRGLYQTAKKIFKLEDRQRYWKKFYPESRPTYVIFSQPSTKFSEIYGIVQALRAKS